MEDLPQFKLVIELINNIIVFDKANNVVFAGDEIRKSLEKADVNFEEIFRKEYPPDSEQYLLKQTLEKARSDQLPRTFKSENFKKVFLFFPESKTNSDNIILSVKDEILQISKIERGLEELIKEMECLYNISHALEASKSLDEGLSKCVQHIKEGFKFPHYTKVTIEIDGKIIGDPKQIKDKKTRSKLVVDIILNEKKRGKIHVYLVKKVKFLKEEEKLIHEISGKISRALEKNEKKNTLEKQQKILLKKNKALIKLTEECAESTENLKTFFSAITDRIIVIDREYNIIMSNKEKIGDKGKCYEKLFNSNRKCENCNAVVTFRDAKNSIHEKKDDHKYYLMRSYPIYDKNEKVDRVLEVCRDITMNKQIESQLIQSYKLASLGKLVAGVAHEINNPNTFILGNLKIIQESFNDIFPILDNHFANNQDEKIARLPYGLFKENISVLINDMIDGSNRTKKIVMDLRNFARKDEDSLSEMIDINYLIKNHLTLTQKHIKKLAKIEFNLKPDIPEFKGSIQKLEQVLMNMIINASQAVENEFGLITVETDFHPVTKEIIIRITDNGKGMDEKTKRNIFDPFYTTKRDRGGTGLGLSISYGIIKDHNGKIEVDSKLGSGTTFTIRIPANINKE